MGSPLMEPATSLYLNLLKREFKFDIIEAAFLAINLIGWVAVDP